jgi:hypothetical protein
METASAYVRLVLSALGGGHPIRLVIGVSCAHAFKLVVHFLAKAYPEASMWSALDDFSLWFYIPLIVPLLFVPIVFGKRGALESAIHQANTIRMLLDEAGIKGVRKQMVWNLFIDQYIRTLASGTRTLTSPDLRQVFDDTLKRLPDGVPSME